MIVRWSSLRSHWRIYVESAQVWDVANIIKARRFEFRIKLNDLFSKQIWLKNQLCKKFTYFITNLVATFQSGFDFTENILKILVRMFSLCAQKFIFVNIMKQKINVVSWMTETYIICLCKSETIETTILQQLTCIVYLNIFWGLCGLNICVSM